MRWALVNPDWRFEGSIYFGCREPHLPLEYGYAKALLEREGHEVLLVDGHLERLERAEIRRRLEAFLPDRTVITTAPSYLFWRCAPPELRVPQEVLLEIASAAGTTVAIGPHASTTPGATLRKLGCDVVVLGEPEEVLPRLSRPWACWEDVPSIAYEHAGALRVQGGLHASDMEALPPLRWEGEAIRRHRHHHHRFDAQPLGPGAEMEASRGCPYHCTFCAKDNFRDGFRKRPLEVVLDEIDALVAQGVRYVYFIDEIFLPDRSLLDALAERDVAFGVQMRIDNWSREMLDRLGAAGCVSIEGGMESVTEKGRSLLAKRCRMSTEELTDLFVHAKRVVPFVQANLIDATTDPPEEVAAWRARLAAHGVWANEPVPLFPYPGSPEYARRWGPCDDGAWERAHAHYLAQFEGFSDIQESRPLPLAELERHA